MHLRFNLNLFLLGTWHSEFFDKNSLEVWSQWDKHFKHSCHGRILDSNTLENLSTTKADHICSSCLKLRFRCDAFGLTIGTPE